MTIVDSSVWIDYFRGKNTPEALRLHELTATDVLATADLVIVEVLQGYRDESEFNKAKSRLTSLIVYNTGGVAIAVESALNFRRLRSLGITVRKTIDTVIATYCILNGHELLYSDRDFDPFVKHLRLRSAMRGT